MSVCIIAAHPLVLREFHRLLSNTPFRPKTAGRLAETNKVSIPRADVYVVDHEVDSIAIDELLSSIKRADAEARILLVGMRFDDNTAFPLLHMGVKGLLEHAQLADQLERALHAVASGGYWVPRALLSRFVDLVLVKTRTQRLSVKAQLSRREKEVVDCLLANLSNKEIATKLNISERTVKFHVSNLLGKFGVGRRADLIVLWYQQASGTMAGQSEVGSAD